MLRVPRPSSEREGGELMPSKKKKPRPSPRECISCGDVGRRTSDECYACSQASKHESPNVLRRGAWVINQKTRVLDWQPW